MKWISLAGNPMCRRENVVQGETYRITVLTDCLVRLEYEKDGKFEDRATQTVVNRDFPPVAFETNEGEEWLEITTKRLSIRYDRKPFSANGLLIQLRGERATSGNLWRYGQTGWNLGGTARTLDGVNGACRLEAGVMARDGMAVLDDGKSLLLGEDGWIVPQSGPRNDLYFFGYGHCYVQCLKDFFHLCGKPPMLPRYALGNWWSRYYDYSRDSYLELMDRFEREQIPLSVAVMDMDWHLVHIDPKYGNGWTGYTWNRELFPDPKAFLEELHGRGMRTTLNVHPADGIRAHEEVYPQMAKAMGIDPESEKPVEFDIASESFLSSYFTCVSHPHEENGVDFWWIDWQQGTETKVEGLDPLWMLNHYYYLDGTRDGRRALILSRYAGPGSHRYPVGFSGDTVISWESLAFQPYFTATASNIGYGWWSHDIGGHMGGGKNDEMEARWYQFGVFSPINRLHSTKNEFNGKEVWRFRPEVRQVMGRFLRLRHALIPYLYTMNERFFRDGIPLVCPMYYRYPNEESAYAVPNQYEFGSQLIVAPIVSAQIAGVNRAKVKVWIPEGNWNDFFTGMHYRGGRFLWMYRDLQSIPVLARDGAIVPMTSEISALAASQNPVRMTARIYGGADGSFVLYEDDNETTAYEEGDCVRTTIELCWEKKEIVIHAPEGNRARIPARRQWKLEISGVTKGEVRAFADGHPLEVLDAVYDEMPQWLTVSLPECPSDSCIRVLLGPEVETRGNDVCRRIFALLDEAEIPFAWKEEIARIVGEGKDLWRILGNLQAMDVDEALMQCICEVILA